MSNGETTTRSIGLSQLQRRSGIVGRKITFAFALAIPSLLLWQLASMATIPLFLPGPARVLETAVGLVADGTLAQDIGISYFRIISGWTIGSLIAFPLAVLAGRVRLIRRVIEPYVDFLRFIPPIALLGLFIIWLGLGESSRIALIVYTALFTVFITTLAGASTVADEKVNAARTLGAKPLQVLTTVVVPATIPHLITGLRVAMGYCFMTVVSAELVAADNGIGYLIWNSRVFSQTDRAFVGIIALGIMGLLADSVLRAVSRRLAYRYVEHS